MNMPSTLHPQAVVTDDEDDSWIAEFRRSIQENSKHRHEEMSRQTTEQFKKAIGNPSLDSDSRALLQQEFKHTMLQINQKSKDEEDMLVEQERTLRRWLKDTDDRVAHQGAMTNTDLTKSIDSNSLDDNATQGESLSGFEDKLRTAMSILMAPRTSGQKDHEALLGAREKELKHQEGLLRRREFLLVQRELEVLRREEELEAVREGFKQREIMWQEELLRLQEEVIHHREEALRLTEAERRHEEERRRREEHLQERRRKDEELRREEERRREEEELHHGELRRRREENAQERRRQEDRRRLEDETRRIAEEARRREEEMRRREKEARRREELGRHEEERRRREEELRRREERTRHEQEETRLTANDDNTRGRSTRVKSISPPPRPSRVSSHSIARSTSTGQYPVRNASSGSASRFSSSTRSTLWSTSETSGSRPSATGSSPSNYSGRSWSTDRSTFDQQGTSQRIWRPTSRPSSPQRSPLFPPTDNTAASGARGLHRSSSSSSQSAMADSEGKKFSSLFGFKYKSAPVGSQMPAPRPSSKSQSETTGGSNERNIHEWERRQQEAAQKQQEQFRAEAARMEKEAIAKGALSMNKDAVIAAWSNYQQWWSTARDKDILRFRTISWPTVTTITAAEDLTVNRIASFVLSPHHSQDKSPKDRIKEQLLRWHPDRFEGRYLPKVPADERDAVRQGVGQVVKALNDLMSRDRDNPFA